MTANIAATVSVTQTLNLPALSVVLNIPASIGGVSVSTLATVFSRAGGDIGRLISDLRAHQWRDAAELTIVDGVFIAGVAGVPGASIAATLVPYVFDLMNAEIDARGRPSLSTFIQHMIYAQTNIAAIAADIQKRDWADATHLELDDFLAVAGGFGAGPAATIARAALNIGFVIAKSDFEPQAFRDFFCGMERMFQDAAHLPATVVMEIQGHYVRDPSGQWQYNPFRGWVRVSTGAAA